MAPQSQKGETSAQHAADAGLLPENIKIVSDGAIIAGAVDAIAEIERCCFEPPWKREDFITELECTDALMLLLFENTFPAGYLCSRTAFEEAHINKICIHPDRRRSGYGKLLLRHALSALALTPCRQVFLEVARSNVAAIRLYEGAGFTVNRVRKKIYYNGDDALEMALSL